MRFATGEAAEHLTQEVRDLGATRLMVIAGHSHRVVAERLVTDLPVAVWHHEIAHTICHVLGGMRRPPLAD